MTTYAKYARLPGQIVMLGFGSIGQAVLPLLIRHLDLPDEPITIFAADANGAEIARESNARLVVEAVTPENYRALLGPLLAEGTLLLNLSVGISSTALIELCQQNGSLYLDMCLEPWPGGYVDPSRPPAQRSNYALREAALALRQKYPNGPTAVLTMGANPGLASIFVKQGLLRIAAENGLQVSPTQKIDWAELARRLDIKTIHIAERDTQVTGRRKQRGEFVNTWSVAGFIGEALQPAELGWGTHELHWPADASRHGNGCDSSIYLNRPGAATRVRSWTPLEGPYHGFLITHGESISISDHLTVWEKGEVAYRPTVHYAYYPCDDAVLSLHELCGSNWSAQRIRRIIRDEITCGMDELGVLLMGNAKGAYWFGSRLSIAQARALVPHNNATSLQVAAGVLAGAVWAAQHPSSGILEPDDLGYDEVMQIARPYLGDVVGVHTDWTPLQGRGQLFSEDLDREDPWQFKNIRVN